ncbi:hypothetical protein KC722_02855 [Candidatus Kaiserbacteria bacterium]|nr:hypothetical protein [Candidatus Kaiserbacteria bacterium]MCB9811376.1 hypothetical protein [Candidatus Nomurabacteria bacterium]
MLRGLLGAGVILLVFTAGYLLGVSSGHNSLTDMVVDREGDAETHSDSPSTTSSFGTTTLNTTTLTDGQRALLKTVGVDADSVTITPAMFACAEAAVGANRLAEIQNGDTPSISEGFKLYGCYTND